MSRLNTFQRNNLITGTQMAAEIPSSSPELRALVVIGSYVQTATGARRPSKYLNREQENLRFWLRKSAPILTARPGRSGNSTNYRENGFPVATALMASDLSLGLASALKRTRSSSSPRRGIPSMICSSTSSRPYECA